MRVTPHPHQHTRPSRDQTTTHRLCRPPAPPRDDSESRPAPNTIRLTRHRSPTPYFPGTAMTLIIPSQN